MTGAGRIIEMLRTAGVQRLFGMPGGGSISDIIAAAERAGLPFSLAQTETGSAFMAAAQAEITGRPGAIVATLGPGACSAMNGTAHALLDRVPLVVITDCEGSEHPEGLHQAFPQTRVFGPVTKLSRRLRAAEFGDVLVAMQGPPPGPVHLDVAADFTSATVGFQWPRDHGFCLALGHRRGAAGQNQTSDGVHGRWRFTYLYGRTADRRA